MVQPIKPSHTSHLPAREVKGGDISVRTLTHDKKFALVRFQEDSRHTHWGFVKVGALDPSSLAQARARVKHTIQGFTHH
jgi:hypothetical protein